MDNGKAKKSFKNFINALVAQFKKIQYNSPVVLTFCLLSAIALFLGYITDNETTYLLFSVSRGPLNEVLFYFRLFGHAIGHVNIEHFFNNFVIILLIGPLLEERYGSKNLLLMILGTAFITGVIHALFFKTVLLGASGIVFMFILLSSFINLQRGRIPLTLILCLFVFIGKELAAQLTATDNIAHIAHIIGGSCGATFGYFSNRKRMKEKDMLDSAAALLKS